MGIEQLALRDIDLEVLRMGKGPPILLLHGLRHGGSRRRRSSIGSPRMPRSSRLRIPGSGTRRGRPASTRSMTWCISISTCWRHCRTRR